MNVEINGGPPKCCDPLCIADSTTAVVRNAHTTRSGGEALILPVAIKCSLQYSFSIDDSEQCCQVLFLMVTEIQRHHLQEAELF
jgi:hypothetical protein